MVSSNIFCIYKPLKWTSNDVVKKIKYALKLKKVGHGGTLDPLADGVLIIGINEGTKLLNNHLNETKQYLTTITFGYETTTLDLEGEVIKRTDIYPKIKEIEIVLNEIKNTEYWQTPPNYSAIKINGKPAYEYARNNCEIKIEPRLVKLIDYKIIEYSNKQLKILIDVSKGFYVRSFARDLATKLNSLGTITQLTRTRSGEHKIENSKKIEDFINEYKK